jgi:hypothetical protein
MQHHMIFLKDQKTEVMTPLFDACASWWTQGPDAKMQVIFIIVFLVFNSDIQNINVCINCLIEGHYILKYAIF